MPEELRVFAFSFRGIASPLKFPAGNPIPHPGVADSPGPGAEERPDRPGAKSRDEWSKMAWKLNLDADQIASEVESQLRRVLPPFVTVQAEIEFAPGSLIVSGSIMLLTWAGSTMLEAAKEETEKALKELVRSSVKRVVNRFLAPEPYAPVLSQLDVQTDAVPAAAPEPAAAPAASASAPAPAPQPVAMPRPQATSLPLWIALATFVLVLLLAADRFLAVTVK